MADTISPPRPIAGYMGFLLGAVALILVLTHFWAGPFAPQQRASVSVGEIAAEMRESAKRALTGATQPAPESPPWDIDRVLKAVTGALAALAAVLGVFAFVRHESRRPAIGAVALGAAAVTFQLFTWMVLAILGVVLLGMIMQNITGILGE